MNSFKFVSFKFIKHSCDGRLGGSNSLIKSNRNSPLPKRGSPIVSNHEVKVPNTPNTHFTPLLSGEIKYHNL